MKERALALASRLEEIGRNKDMGRPPINDTEREAAALIRELQSRLESLEKDAVRLDWLESSKESHAFCHVGYDEHRYYVHQKEGYATVREVIDAAMKG